MRMRDTYRLVDVGFSSYKNIAFGRKTIGRVTKTPNGWFGVIYGSAEFQGKSENEAFNEVVARHCGHKNYATMAAKNSAVRTVNRQRRAEARYVAEEAISGNFKPLDQLLNRALKKEGQ